MHYTVAVVTVMHHQERETPRRRRYKAQRGQTVTFIFFDSS